MILIKNMHEQKSVKMINAIHLKSKIKSWQRNYSKIKTKKKSFNDF